MALPIKDDEGINLIQPAHTNITWLDQSTMSSLKLESTTEAEQHKDKSTTQENSTNSTSRRTENSLNDIKNNSTDADADAAIRPIGIGTRLSANLLKILVLMG